MAINYPVVEPNDDIKADDFNTLRKDIVRNAGDFNTTGGSANAQTLTIDSDTLSGDIIDGFKVRFFAGFTTTIPNPTLNVNGFGALTLVNRDNNTLTAAIVAGGYYEAVKKGSNWIVANVLDPQFTIPNTIVYDTPSTFINRGDTSTQYNVTNPSGSTFRFTWNGVGTNPNISSVNVPVGQIVSTYTQGGGTSLSAGNIGSWEVIASGTNWFEVINPSGVVETNRTMFLKHTTAGLITYTKPANLAYIKIRLIGGGSGGSGGEAGFSRFGNIMFGQGGTVTDGGIAKGGDLNLKGEGPQWAYANTGSGFRPRNIANKNTPLGQYGSGGGNAQSGSSGSPDTGSSGGYSEKIIPASSLGATELIAVGAGSNGSGTGLKGGDGAVIIEQHFKLGL